MLCGGWEGRDVQGISNTTGDYGGIARTCITKMCSLEWILVASFALFSHSF